MSASGRVQVTHPERVMFPADGLTKGDVVAYYRRVGTRMLPHVVGRPLTLERFPRGIESRGFFQKNAGTHFPDWIARIDRPRRGGVTSHPAVDSVEGLAYLANQGTLVFHAPTGRLPALDRPDRLVIDLDPEPGDVAGARRAARWLRAHLDDLGLPSVPLVTGSKGYHVIVPLTATAGWREVSRAAHQLAAVLLAEHPEALTDAFFKTDRAGRVLLDWMRNMPGATAVVPWSLRPRPGAPVAVPIGWEALDATAPDGVRMTAIESALARPDPILTLTPGDPQRLTRGAAALADAHGVDLTADPGYRNRGRW